VSSKTGQLHTVMSSINARRDSGRT